MTQSNWLKAGLPMKQHGPFKKPAPKRVLDGRRLTLIEHIVTDSPVEYGFKSCQSTVVGG